MRLCTYQALYFALFAGWKAPLPDLPFLAENMETFTAYGK